MVRWFNMLGDAGSASFRRRQHDYIRFAWNPNKARRRPRRCATVAWIARPAGHRIVAGAGVSARNSSCHLRLFLAKCPSTYRLTTPHVETVFDA
jgi:hypothetical protein